MKTRTVIPLLFVLGFLLVSAGSGTVNACPYGLETSLDVASVTYNSNQTPLTPTTVHGWIKFYGIVPGDYEKLNISITTATQWSTVTRVDGNIVEDGDVIEMTDGQVLSLEISVVPNSTEAGTEIYGISFKCGCNLGGKSLSLITTNSTAAVSSDLLMPSITFAPNPAGSYIFMHGLNNVSGGYQYKIFSTTGAEVLHGLMPSDGRINVQDIPSGAYMLLLSDEKRTYSNMAFTVLH